MESLIFSIESNPTFGIKCSMVRKNMNLFLDNVKALKLNTLYDWFRLRSVLRRSEWLMRNTCFARKSLSGLVTLVNTSPVSYQASWLSWIPLLSVIRPRDSREYLSCQLSCLVTLVNTFPVSYVSLRSFYPKITERNEVFYKTLWSRITNVHNNCLVIKYLECNPSIDRYFIYSTWYIPSHSSYYCMLFWRDRAPCISALWCTTGAVCTAFPVLDGNGIMYPDIGW